VFLDKTLYSYRASLGPRGYICTDEPGVSLQCYSILGKAIILLGASKTIDKIRRL